MEDDPGVGRCCRQQVSTDFWQLTGEGMGVTKRSMTQAVLAAGFILALAGCTNPYDPAQRAVGGGLIGAGAGAAIGGAAAGGAGAATGAAIGGAVGAVTGVVTTPPPPPPPPYRPY